MSELLTLAVQNAPLLRHLADVAGGGNATEIGRAIQRDRSNVAKSLKALTDAGLVTQHALGWFLTYDGKEQVAMLQRAVHTVGDPDGAIRLRHDQIKPDADQDRRSFDQAELEILAESLFRSGLQQPPKVGPAGADGLHELVMGERRWRAWGLLVESGRWPADHTELCPIADGDELARREAALAENAARVDLNHMEYAHAFERLATRYGRSNKEIAATVGRTPEFVQQHRRLVKLDPDDQARVASGGLPFHEALQELRRSIGSLAPFHQLAAAELAAKLVREHGNLAIYKRTTIQADAPEEDKQALKEFFQFVERDYADLQPKASVWYGADDRLRKAFPWLTSEPGPALDAALCELQAATEAAEMIGGDGYVTAWLNGPFVLSEEARALAEARAREEANNTAANEEWHERRRREAAEHKARQEHLRQAEAKAREVALGFDKVDVAAVKELLASEAPLPWRYRPGADEYEVGEIVDANGAELRWDNCDVLYPLIMAAMNAAIGEGAEILPPQSEDEDDLNDEDEDEPTDQNPPPSPPEGSSPDAAAVSPPAASPPPEETTLACSDGARAPRTGPLAAMLNDDFSRQLRAVREKG